jgi:hypothetical protein
MPYATMGKIWNVSPIENHVSALILITNAISAITEAKTQTVPVNYQLNKLPRPNKNKRKKCAVNTVTMKSVRDTGKCLVTFVKEDSNSHLFDTNAVSVAISCSVSKEYA